MLQREVPAGVLFVLLAPLLSGLSFDDLYRKGLVALQQGDLVEARSSLQQASKLQPKNARVWIGLAQTLWKLHDTGNSDAAAAKALEYGSGDTVVLSTLVIYYSESSRPLFAAEAQARFAAARPGDSAASERAASLYFEAVQPMLQKGQFADVIPLVKKASAGIGKQLQLEVALGVAYYGLRSFDESAAAFLRAIESDPNARQPYEFLGKMLDQIPARLPEVTRHFVAFEQSHPNDSMAYLLHAKALNAQVIEPEIARSLLEKSIALNGNDADAHFELGALLERLHLSAEAAAEFERAAVLQPADAATHYHLARLYDRLDKPELAQLEREKHRQLSERQNAAR